MQPEKLALLDYREYPAGSNWKSMIENHVDCLDVPFLHYRTNNWEFDNLFYSYCRPHHISHYPYDKSPKDLKPLPGLNWDYPAFGSNVVFPNLITIIWEGVCNFMHVLPISAEKSVWRWFVLGHEDKAPSKFVEFYEKVVFEDIEAGDWLQTTVKSPHFSVGPMAKTYEEPVAKFHEAYVDLLPL
ncbi:MAG: hypothetical protein CMO26_12690 [Thiotrichales bacterium]|nr:hypothetical protein [Thiotrichales bacterium]